MPFDPVTLGIGAGVSLLGGLFGGPKERNWQNYWSDVNFKSDFSRLDPYDQLQDFGQGAAWTSYNKAGLLGQQMTEGLGGLQRDELSNLRRMTMDSTPTMAALRGTASAQGAGGQMSNVLARQQRMGAQAQASEAYGQQASQVGSRYQQNLLSSLATAEGLRQSALGQYLGAQGSAQQLKGNIQLQRTSQENDIGARIAIANAQGRSQAQQYADQQPENPWLTTGLGIMATSFRSGGYGGGEGVYGGGENTKSGYGGYDFGGTKDGGFNYEMSGGGFPAPSVGPRNAGLIDFSGVRSGAMERMFNTVDFSGVRSGASTSQGNSGAPWWQNIFNRGFSGGGGQFFGAGYSGDY